MEPSAGDKFSHSSSIIGMESKLLTQKWNVRKIIFIGSCRSNILILFIHNIIRNHKLSSIFYKWKLETRI